MATYNITGSSIGVKFYNGGWSSWKINPTAAYIGYSQGSYYAYCIKFTLPNDWISTGSVNIKTILPLVKNYYTNGTFYYKIFTTDPTTNNSSGQLPASGEIASSSYNFTGLTSAVTNVTSTISVSTMTAGATYYIFFGCNSSSSAKQFTQVYANSTYPVSIKLEYTSYTAPTAPLFVQLFEVSGSSINTGNYYYYKSSGGKINLSWHGESNGTNNAIQKYAIYRSKNGSEYQLLDYSNSSPYEINVSSNELDTRDYYTYKIVSIGKYSNSSQSSSTSPRLYKNTIPTAPIGYTKTVASTVTNTSLSYTVGNDPDGQTITTYYSTKLEGNKTEYKGENLNIGTYYLWSYDGLEYSDCAIAITRKDTAAPNVSNFTTVNTTFTPYYNNTSYIYVTTIKLTSVSATKGQYSNIDKYNLYYSQGSTADSTGITKPTGTLISSSSNAPSTRLPISLNVGNVIKAGYYFKIGVSVITSLGEESEINWNSSIYCYGKTITSTDFHPSLTINSKIDNFKNEFNAGDLENYFNNYIKIEWTNPTIETPYFGISKIECGLTNISSTNFTSFSAVTSINQLISGNINSEYLNIGDSITRGFSVIPALRVYPINGSSFIISSNITKIRTNKLKFSSDYKITPITWNYFSNSYSNIEFNGNKILGDGGFAKISNVSIKNDKLSDSYTGSYTIIDSSTPGHIEFAPETFEIFKTAIGELKLDSLINITYTITVTDRYGNTAFTTVTQEIDFRVNPEWTSDATLKVKVKYKGSTQTSSITDSTSLTERILNPGDIITLSWPAANDGGNGNNHTIKYEIWRYEKLEEDELSIDYEDDTYLVKKDIVLPGNIEYSYTIPSGSTNVRSIYFKIYALDQSGLYSTNALNMDIKQILAIGRALAPIFEASSYEIDSNGKFTGQIKISDYGDSRIINTNWRNYKRLGLTLNITINSIKTTRVFSDDSEILSFEIINTNITSGKATLTFTLFPTNLTSLSSTKTYIFSFDGPTFSYRNHQIGINIQADAENDTALIINGSTSNKKDKIKFIVTKANWEDIYFDLSTAEIHNLIIDCGEW